MYLMMSMTGMSLSEPHTNQKKVYMCVSIYIMYAGDDISTCSDIPYSQKIWRGINLAVCRYTFKSPN